MVAEAQVDAIRSADAFPAQFWRRAEDGRVECGLCPRQCRLGEGQRGFCFVRGNLGGALVLLAYGRSSGFCADPIEKKPLNHFLPGTAVFSFGTAGCNLACRFCQNWDLSRARDQDRLLDRAGPEAIARAALDLGCRSVAFTYNDPVVFHEYCLDTALACHALGLRTVAVTAGYQCAGPRRAFYRHMDAANIDLKAFSEAFYQRFCGAHLQPVLETLLHVRHETRTWLELTTLLIPGANDSEAELQALTQWVAEHLGPDVPLHFTAFHPAGAMPRTPATPLATLLEARRIALGNGLRHVYLGNVPGGAWEGTHCHACGHLLIGRDGYRLTAWNLAPGGACPRCTAPCPGVFETEPGTWGPKRVPARLRT